MVTVVPIALAVASALTWLLVVPRIRIDDDEAPDLSRLVSWRSTVVVGAATLLMAQVLRATPVDHWWLWAPYLWLGVPLVAVDLCTTFLPARLNHLTLGAMAVAAIPMTLTQPRLGLWAVLGAAAVYGVFYLVWRLGLGIGFGDVRLAALIGAVSGPSGAQGVSVAVFAGTALGAVHALAHHVWACRDARRPRHFAYGPALYAGPVLAVGLGAIAG